MGTAREVLKNKNPKTKQFLHKAGTGKHPQQSRCLGLFFHCFFLLKVLAMNSGRVQLIDRLWERERAGEAWGRERQTPPRPETGFLEGSVQEKGHTGGTLTSGGSLEPRCLRKIFTCIRHAGAGALSCPVGARRSRGHQPLDGDSGAQPRHLCKSVHSLWATIYRQEAWGSKSGVVAVRRNSGASRGRQRWVCSPCPGPQPRRPDRWLC